VNVRQILRVLAARWWVVAAVFLVTVGATAIVSLLLPKSYTATTSLVLEPRSTDVLGTANFASAMMAQSFVATQIDIMQSRRVAARAVELLGIARSPTAIEQFREATGGQGRIEDYFADILSKRLDIRPSRESTVVELSFTANDPNFAAQVADAFARAYIETTLELRTSPARQYASWFNEQLKVLRSNMEQAQTRLSEFQQAKGIVGSDERLDVENARLAELSTQLVVAQSQAVEARARSAQGAPTVHSVPDVSSTPVMQMLRADLLRSEAKLQELAGALGPNHPTFQRQEAEVQSLRERLEHELRNASAAVGSVSRASTSREAELRAAVAGQKQRVLDIKRLRDQMGVLQREAENAQRVYDLALQRLAQNTLESQANQTGASVLSAAAIPSTPTSPRIELNVFLSAVLGLLIGIAAAILLEISDRRLRSNADFELVGSEVPLLASLQSSRSRKRLAWWSKRDRPALGVSGAA
jgi:chain length determinant protein EpsF